MALICARPLCNEFQQECLAIASEECVTVGTLAASSRSETATAPAVLVRQLKVSESPVVCLAFSPTGRLLAACADDKTLRVWWSDGWETVGERKIPKRGVALQFTMDDKYVLVADKTGEVFRYEVSNLAAEGKHLLGHFSMLLDMILSFDNSHVITCDRDEKIRVSKYPNAYNIEAFCLGHTEFVSKVCLCAAYPNILVSGSGVPAFGCVLQRKLPYIHSLEPEAEDGTIRTWDWINGKLLHTQRCSLPVDGKDPLAVTWVACSHEAENPVVLASLESSTDIRLFSLHSDGKLFEASDAVVSLSNPVRNCALDDSDRLWVCVLNEQEPLQCFRVGNGKLANQTHQDSPLLENLCKWNYFKDCVCRETNWSQLRKHVFDNISAYLARKEERIKTKEAQKAAREEMKPKSPKIPKLEVEDSSHTSTGEEL